MADTVTDTTVSHTSGLEGLCISNSARSLRISKDDHGKPLIMLSGENISAFERRREIEEALKGPDLKTDSPNTKIVFDVTKVRAADEVPFAYFVTLTKQSPVELVVTPTQHDKLKSMRLDKLQGPNFQITPVEGVAPSSRDAAPSTHATWSSSLRTPSMKFSLNEDGSKSAGHLSPPSTKGGTTQVLTREGYVEIIPPADILHNDEWILSLGAYVKSLAKDETYRLNLSGAQGAKCAVLAGVLVQISIMRQQHNAPPIEVSLPLPIKEDVMRLCKRAAVLMFV